MAANFTTGINTDSFAQYTALSRITIPAQCSNRSVLTGQERRGVDVGEVKTDIISGPGALDVAKQRGAYEPLKNVIGIDYPILQRVFYNKADRALRDKFNL